MHTLNVSLEYQGFLLLFIYLSIVPIEAFKSTKSMNTNYCDCGVIFLRI